MFHDLRILDMVVLMYLQKPDSHLMSAQLLDLF